MSEWEVWFDVEARRDEGDEVVCALFGRMTFPIRPTVGERITFFPPRDYGTTFNLLMAWGSMPSSAAALTVDDISHYRTAVQDGGRFTATLRFEPLKVASIADARKVVRFLMDCHGFEVDPYGVNKLHE